MANTDILKRVEFSKVYWQRNIKGISTFVSDIYDTLYNQLTSAGFSLSDSESSDTKKVFRYSVSGYLIDNIEVNLSLTGDYIYKISSIRLCHRNYANSLTYTTLASYGPWVIDFANNIIRVTKSGSVYDTDILNVCKYTNITTGEFDQKTVSNTNEALLSSVLGNSNILLAIPCVVRKTNDVNSVLENAIMIDSQTYTPYYDIYMISGIKHRLVYKSTTALVLYPIE